MASPDKGPGGRPSLYDPAYCDQIQDFMADGYSLTAFAGSIGVSRATVYNWAEEHPQFFDALSIAKAKAAFWWEQRVRKLAETGEGNATAVVFGLKNRVADEWRDVSRQEHVSPDGSMTPKPALDVSKLSTQALAEIMALSDASRVG